LANDLVVAAIDRLEATIAENPEPTTAACRRGCGWCCHQPVFLTAPEAVVVAAHLRATWTSDRIRELRAELATRSAERQEQIADRRLLAAGMPCVFLDEDNACSIHAVRPLICRGFTSSSSDACAERYIDPVKAPPPPVDLHAYTATRAILHGLSAALTGAGLAGGMGELNALLQQLLAGDIASELPG
jgi:Fe-S-cluster containining protein